MTSYRYRVFGLEVSVDRPLPDLPEIGTAAIADVAIRHAPIAPSRASEPVGLSIEPRGALLNIPDVGRYLIAGGSAITVDPAPGATERNVRLYLLGSAFGAILHQRAMLPLHANTVGFGHAAVAFMGHSGAGKSTLAAWFHDRGQPVLGDDVCVVAADPTGIPHAVPGLPRIRLWSDALAASGRQSAAYEASFDDTDKYDVPTDAQATQPARPLAAIYELRRAERADAPGAVRLTGVDAVQVLVANTYRGAFVPMMDGVQRHLAQCIALSRQVPVFALYRTWDLAAFAGEAAAIAEQVERTLDGR